MVDTMLSRRAFLGITAGGALALYLPTASATARRSQRRSRAVRSRRGRSRSSGRRWWCRRRCRRSPPESTRSPSGSSRSRSCRAGLPATHRVGLRLGGPSLDVQLPGVHDRGETRDTDDGDVDQRPRPTGPAASCRTCCRSIRRCTGPTRPAASPGATAGRRSRPRRGRTAGPVPICVHVHGMEDVAGLERRLRRGVVPAGCDRHPQRLRHRRHLARLLRGEGRGRRTDLGCRAGWSAATRTRQVPSTLWYHDHVLGMTRLNVYAGPAGFWLLRSDDPADNPTVAGTGAPAVLPGPAPQLGERAGHPSLRDPARRSRTAPSTRTARSSTPTRGRSSTATRGPYVPDTDVPPIWNPEFFGNCMVVNGRTWPFLDVEPRRYRFRVLNGCNSRFLILRVRRPAVEIWQIGNEGGYLPAPLPVRELLLAPAERADLIVDFSRMRVRLDRRRSSTAARTHPFGGGGFRPADPRTTGRVMQFRVIRAGPAGLRRSLARHPSSWSCRRSPRSAAGDRGPARWPWSRRCPTRRLPTSRSRPSSAPSTRRSGCRRGPRPASGSDPVTENPAVGDSELWELYNFTEDAHPIHIHEVLFQVVDRQRLDRRTGRPIGRPTPPPPDEHGFKDTVIAYPGRGHPGPDACSATRASSSGTATSSSTRTTR